MRSYTLALVQACHKRGAPAMGGMSALIPIKNDPVANEKTLAGNGCVPIHNLMEDAVTAQGEDTATYDQAAEIFDRMSLTPDYPEFLTLPLYEAMA
jgi:malate synthase